MMMPETEQVPAEIKVAQELLEALQEMIDEYWGTDATTKSSEVIAKARVVIARVKEGEVKIK